jgi:hypothetical protein
LHLFVDIRLEGRPLAPGKMLLNAMVTNRLFRFKAGHPEQFTYPQVLYHSEAIATSDARSAVCVVNVPEGLLAGPCLASSHFRPHPQHHVTASGLLDTLAISQPVHRPDMFPHTSYHDVGEALQASIQGLSLGMSIVGHDGGKVRRLHSGTVR